MSHLNPTTQGTDGESETPTSESVPVAASGRPFVNETGAAGDSIARIEFAMEYIREALQSQGQAITLVADQLADLHATQGNAPQPDVMLPADIGDELLDQVPEENETEPAEEPGNSWAQMKLAVLEEHNGGLSASQVPPKPEAIAKNGHQAACPSSDGESVADNTPPESALESVLARIPALANVNDLADDQLRKAVADRDQVIRMLIAQLRRPPAVTLTTEQLKHFADKAPDVLEERIEDSLQSLDRQVRLGELELSLERARIARQVTTLQATHHKLRQTARAFGMTLNEDGGLEGEVQTPVKGSRGRRWLGVLGFGN